MAARVSAVSPDWEMAMTTSFSLMTGLRVTELGGVFNFYRDTRKVFDDIFTDQTGMPGGPAGSYDDPVGMSIFGR